MSSVNSLSNSHAVAIVADFDSAYTRFKLLVTGKEMSVPNIALFIMDAIRVVEEVTKNSGDKGEAKKALALRLVERLVQDLPLDLKTKKKIIGALDSVGPSVIDALIEADHGELLRKGKKVWQSVKEFLSRKCTCCCRQ